ncbi:DUF2188 domain-containing protein [Cupriavidus sp. CuC1]|uniref:DUF2188 domain-containing protein n=1 Tax=Cupriavidus sp. CuC1 TaxID=3373131 RepID=UPI0037CE2FC7
MSPRNIHVVRMEAGRWAVAVEGADEAPSQHASREEAIAVGAERAKQSGVELVVHGRDGRIRRRSRFSHEAEDCTG